MRSIYIIGVLLISLIIISEVRELLDKHRQDQLIERFDRVDNKLNQLIDNTNYINSRFNDVNTKLDSINSKLDILTNIAIRSTVNPDMNMVK